METLILKFRNEKHMSGFNFLFHAPDSNVALYAASFHENFLVMATSVVCPHLAKTHKISHIHCRMRILRQVLGMLLCQWGLKYVFYDDSFHPNGDDRYVITARGVFQIDNFYISTNLINAAGILLLSL